MTWAKTSRGTAIVAKPELANQTFVEIAGQPLTISAGAVPAHCGPFGFSMLPDWMARVIEEILSLVLI